MTVMFCPYSIHVMVEVVALLLAVYSCKDAPHCMRPFYNTSAFQTTLQMHNHVRFAVTCLQPDAWVHSVQFLSLAELCS
jgi:hypothetical protein